MDPWSKLGDEDRAVQGSSSAWVTSTTHVFFGLQALRLLGSSSGAPHVVSHFYWYVWGAVPFPIAPQIQFPWHRVSAHQGLAVMVLMVIIIFTEHLQVFIYVL